MYEKCVDNAHQYLDTLRTLETAAQSSDSFLYAIRLKVSKLVSALKKMAPPNIDKSWLYQLTCMRYKCSDFQYLLYFINNIPIIRLVFINNLIVLRCFFLICTCMRKIARLYAYELDKLVLGI